jgi:hypothetical protein
MMRDFLETLVFATLAIVCVIATHSRDFLGAIVYWLVSP